MCSMIECRAMHLHSWINSSLSSSSASSFHQQDKGSSPTNASSIPASKSSFVYDRASPSVRWPQWHEEQLKIAERAAQSQANVTPEDPYQRLARLSGISNSPTQITDENSGGYGGKRADGSSRAQNILPELVADTVNVSNPAPHILPAKSDFGLVAGKKKRSKLSRLALLKATDWRERVARLCTAVCKLPVTHSVADLLNEWPEQLAPTDYCILVKQVGQHGQWARSLELFEWLNMEFWYTPNNRMLSAILGVLGRAGQVDLAEEIFQRVQPELGDCVQVFNAMLGVHARQGNWERMQTLLKVMLEKGCERDLITYNTLISGRAKSGLQPGMAMELLREIWQAGLCPDTVTYNTLISMSSLNKCYEDAVMVYEEMKEQGCQADVWTFNSMISVYGRCGLDVAAEEVYLNMKEKGFTPDAVTYNSILFAYAKRGRIEEVELVRRQMQEVGCREDVITYNTMIDMYGKKNLLKKALDIYEKMKEPGSKKPDIVTYVVLIDGLGKAGQVEQAELVFNEMVNARFKPSLNVFCAMICAYAKAKLYNKAVIMYQDMLQAGVQLDGLAFSVMLDVFLNLGQAANVLSIYNSMSPKYKPGLVQCELMLRLFKRDELDTEVELLTGAMQQYGFDPAEMCSIFAKSGLCDAAEKAFMTAISLGQNVDASTRELLLKAFTRARRFKDAQSLVNSVSAQGLEDFPEQLIVSLCNAERFDEAKEELAKLKLSGRKVSINVFRAFVVAYELAGMWKESVEMLQEMQGLGFVPDVVCCRSGLLAYCRLNRPDQGHLLLQQIVSEYGGVKDAALHLVVIKAYIKLELWNESEMAFRELKETGLPVLLKDYELLLLAYARSGQAQQMQNLFKYMVEDEAIPNSGFVVILLESLLSAGRLVEIGEVYQQLQEMGVILNMKTHIVMINAFAKCGNVEQAKSFFEKLKNEGYILPVEVYNVLIGMFSKAGSVENAESIMKEMKECGFEPNIFCYNAMLSVYGKAKNFKKAAQVYQGMQIAGCQPDTVTFNTLIHMYSRCLHTQEAYTLLQQMKESDCVPDLLSYSMLIKACGQMQMWEAAGVLFKEVQNSGIKIDQTTYHLMIDIYRKAGRPELALDVVTQMKDHGFESTASTMHMVMDSYGKGGQMNRAAEVFDSMVDAGVEMDVSHYTSLIDAYLKEDDHKAAISNLKKMESKGIKANFATWTCVIGAASKCENREDMLMLLRVLRDIGFPIPLKLLIARDTAVFSELQCLLDSLQYDRAGAASGVVNVILDLLWAFQKRSTAAAVFNLALASKIYDREFSRVNEGDWGADLCKLSPGGALVALSLWLVRMQEAALQGSPAYVIKAVKAKQ